MLSAPCFLPETPATVARASTTRGDVDAQNDATGSVLPGGVVTTLHGYMRGYGTYAPEEQESTLGATVVMDFTYTHGNSWLFFLF
jgi:hypothetical protein